MLMMCIRMWWLHCIVDVSGEGAPGICFMMLSSVCVPHSVVPGCCVAIPWAAVHGPCMWCVNHALRVGDHFRCPCLPYEL